MYLISFYFPVNMWVFFTCAVINFCYYVIYLSSSSACLYLN